VPEHSEPGSYAHLHRLLADRACAAVLDAQASQAHALRSSPSVRRRSDDELAEWFPDELAIKDDPFPAGARGT
jgi:hypothetical protein